MKTRASCRFLQGRDVGHNRPVQSTIVRLRTENCTSTEHKWVAHSPYSSPSTCPLAAAPVGTPRGCRPLAAEALCGTLLRPSYIRRQHDLLRTTIRIYHYSSARAGSGMTADSWRILYGLGSIVLWRRRRRRRKWTWIDAQASSKRDSQR